MFRSLSFAPALAAVAPAAPEHRAAVIGRLKTLT
jgi:hypothetical protein